jgi:CheY-specific phosphatase CheX
MDSVFLSAFMYSLEKMANSMLGSACMPLGTSGTESSGSYVSGVVYFSGTRDGRLALSFARRTAKRMVAEMLGTSPVNVDDAMLQDGVAEMANIVAGNAKALLSDTRYRVTMSLPRVVLGQSFHPGSRPLEKAHYRCFDTGHGMLSLAVWLMPQEKSEGVRS